MAVTLEAIKDEYAKELGYKNWADYCENVENMSTLPDINEHVTEIAKRYAEACCKATLEKAAASIPKGGRCWHENGDFDTDEISTGISHPSNIVLL